MKRWFLASAALVLTACAVFFAVGVPTPARAATGWNPPAVKIAVVDSQGSQDYCISEWGSHAPDVKRREVVLLAYLKDKGWNATEITENDCRYLDRLKQYDVVVMAYQMTMGADASAALQRYVAEGGGVVGLGQSPRVDPAYNKGPGGNQEFWWSILKTNSYEWGPLSEAYQFTMVDDPGAPNYHAYPVNSHPIVAGAKTIMGDRGLTALGDQLGWALNRDFSGARGGGLELVSILGNGASAKPFLNLQSDSTVLSKYPRAKVVGAYPAGIASQYFKGRTAYFPIGVEDFLHHYDDTLASYPGTWNWRYPDAYGQGDLAGAYIESAIAWAADQDHAPAAVVRGGITWAKLNVYNGEIYCTQYVGNIGSVSAVGDLYRRVYDPSGRLVSNWQHAGGYVGGTPGSVYHYSNSYSTARLADGLYRVEFEYVTNYPTWTTRWREVAYVRRGQGVNITTHVWGAAAPVISDISAAPTAFSPDGDGRSDLMWVNFRTDRPSSVTVKVYDRSWHLVAQPLTGASRASSYQSVRWNGKRANGTWLPAGLYYVSVYAGNTAGTRSLTTPVTVAY